MPRPRKSEEEKAQYLKEKNKRYYEQNKDKFKHYYEEYKQKEKPDEHLHIMYCVVMPDGKRSIHITTNQQHQYKRTWGEIQIVPLLVFHQEIPDYLMKCFEYYLIAYFGKDNCINQPGVMMIDKVNITNSLKLLSQEHKKFIEKVMDTVTNVISFTPKDEVNEIVNE